MYRKYIHDLPHVPLMLEGSAIKETNAIYEQVCEDLHGSICTSTDAIPGTRKLCWNYASTLAINRY